METQNLLSQLETLRGSRVLSYFTSDRQGPLNARIAMDIVPIFSKQLRQIGKADKIDLLLYSSGGDTMVPWRLVAMMREYCDKLSVLIPYKAHSAATMISLGADEIVMSDLSELSPIDPSTANPFNPEDPKNPNNKIPISVEEVMAFMDLAKNKIGIKNDTDLTQIFNKFIEANPQIHPLALGNVNRTYNLIRILAKRLLKSHQSPMAEHEIDKIVDDLTEKLYSHHYFIGRKEAREDIGLKTVQNAEPQVAELMTKIYEAKKEEMSLGAVWNPENEIGENNATNKKDYTIASIASKEVENNFTLTAEYKREQINVQQQTPSGPIQVPQQRVTWRMINQGWK